MSLVCLAACARAAEVTQSRALSVTKSGSGTGTLVVVGTEGLVGTGFTPFDSSLGTLTSFTVKWDATLTTSATVSPSSSGGGGITASVGGNFYLNDANNSGGGNGGGGGAAPGAVINSQPVVLSKLMTFRVPDSPATYNPAWLAGVTGTSNFTLSFIGAAPSSPPSNLAKVDYNGLSSISSTLAATVTLTYTYTPPPVSVTLNGASGQVPHALDLNTDTGLILSLGFDADYLVIGGGGSGGTAGGSGGQGTWGAGGGGAGGFLSGTKRLTPQSYAVTVGAGGLAAAFSSGGTSTGRDGQSSVFDQFTALGGGGGAGGDNANGGDGRSGASGGGGGSKYANPGGSGTSPQGYAGGAARSGDPSSAGNRTAGGGGGGAGEAGRNAGPWSSVAGAGGAGRASVITGTSVTYAGGGGGGARDIYGGQQSGAGGTGGGGAGSTQGNATPGTNGLGGGGGGSGADGKGGDGGSGLVIVRYLGTPAGTGGTVTSGSGSASGYTLHTFSTAGDAALDLSGMVPGDRLGAVLSGTISGAGGLTYNGPGTLTLAGANTYSGSTTVSAGTLAVGGNSLPDAGNLIISGGKVAANGTEVIGTLYINGVRQPFGSYGATGSGATYINDTYFSGTSGVIQTSVALRPIVALTSFTQTGVGSVLLGGTVNPNGLTTTAVIEYGSTPSYGTSSPVTLGTANGTTAQSVSLPLSNLAFGIYHYRITATNVDGSTSSTDGTFSLIEPSDGTPDAVYQNANGNNLTISSYGYVTESAFDANGHWLAAGTFAGYNGTLSKSLVCLNPDGSADASFHANLGSGLANIYDDGNVSVDALLVKSNGQILVGGAFTSLSGIPTGRGIACINPDGTPDTAFTNKLNALSLRFGNSAMVEQPDGKIIGSSSSGGVIRLKTDGTLDSTFTNPGSGGYGVKSIELQPDGKILVGGFFPTYGGKSLAGLVRLNANGSMDTAFNNALGTGFPRNGYKGAVETTRVAPDGKIWVGGYFTFLNGQPVPGLVRLNQDGTLDTACQTAIGTPFAGSNNSAISALLLQPDGRIIIGGLFDKFNNLATCGLCRLNSDGSPDLTFSQKFGAGVDWSVMTIGLRPTGEIMIGGNFSSISGQRSRSIAQLGWSGTLSPASQTVSGTYGTAITPTSTFATSRISGTVSYTISPALPAGLSLNSSTGVVSGTPRAVVTAPRTYTLTATGSTRGTATSTLTLSVAKAPLTISAKNASRAYGRSNPSFGITISGLVNGDTTTAVSGAPFYACAATSSSAPGSYAITPSLGSLSAINYSFSAFTAGSLTVEKAAQTLSIAPLANTVPLKDLSTVSLSAASSAGLPVTLSLDAGSAAVLSGTVGSYSLTDIGQTGTVTVRASQAGNSNYSAAQDVVVSFDVTKSNQTITFASLADKTYGDSSFNLTAMSNSGLPVSFSLVSGPAELQGSTCTLTGAGTVVIRASQAGSDLYNEAAAEIRSFIVAPASQTIAFGALTDVTYGGAPLALSATSNSGLSVTYSIVSGPASINAGSLTPNAAGTIVIRASQAGDDNHHAADPVERSLTVNRKALAVTGATAVDKTADATTVAKVFGAQLAGVVTGDEVLLANHLAGTFSQASPGNNLSVTTAMTLEGADAGSYLLTQPTLTASITASQDNHTHQELWRFANFGSYDSLDSAADSADPDGDGLNNLLEYALGTAPNSPGVIPGVPALNGANLEYTYTRSTEAKDNGVTYQIEWSDTLEAGSWSTQTVTEQIQGTEGALETVKASVPAGSGSKRFLRLRVAGAVGVP